MTVIGQFYHFFGLVFGNHYYLESVITYKAGLQENPAAQTGPGLSSNTTMLLRLLCSSFPASVSMSPKYFCRFFSEMTHQTPMDYLNHQRIEQACYQLSTTDDSITEIAYRNGFNDLSYFIQNIQEVQGDDAWEI